MRSDGASLLPPPRHRGLRGLLGVHPALVLLFGAALFVPRLTSTYWTFNLMVGLVLGISCLGLLVVAGWAREISLAQAGLTGSALYLCGYGYRDPDSGFGRGWSFPVAAAWAIGFVVAVSFLTALVSMRLAGAYVVVVVVLALIPQILLAWKLNVYLLGGVGMTVGVFLGPRGLGRLVPRGF